MATTTTKKTTTTTAAPSKTEKELNKKIADQEAMIAELTAKVNALLSATTTITQPNTAVAKKSTKMVTFINLVPGTLVLQGSGSKIWTIEGQFNSRTFTEAEASVIVSNSANVIQKGGVWITDNEFIDEHNLTDVFNNILSEKILRTILEQDSNKVVELYLEASDLQKQVIVSMIEGRIDEGREVDRNILSKIGRLCKKDLTSLADDAENEGTES